jgi:hypothetical protein
MCYIPTTYLKGYPGEKSHPGHDGTQSGMCFMMLFVVTRVGSSLKTGDYILSNTTQVLETTC